MPGVIDTIYTFRFLKIFSTKWENTDAYRLGIIDEDGEPLKKSADLTTTAERKSYTPFVRLVFKFKRMMGAIPGGKSATARYGAALLLIKENKEEAETMGINLKQLEEGLKRYIDDVDDINEEVTNTAGGIEGKDQPLGKKGKVKKRKKQCDDEVVDKNNTDTDNKNEETDYRYQMIGGVLIRVDEKKRVVKKRIVKGKRSKKREYATSKSSKYTRTGKRKLRGSKLMKKRKSLKKAKRKAQTGSAKAKRKRSMKKSRKYK